MASTLHAEQAMSPPLERTRTAPQSGEWGANIFFLSPNQQPFRGANTVSDPSRMQSKHADAGNVCEMPVDDVPRSQDGQASGTNTFFSYQLWRERQLPLKRCRGTVNGFDNLGKHLGAANNHDPWLSDVAERGSDSLAEAGACRSGSFVVLGLAMTILKLSIAADDVPVLLCCNE